MSSTPHDPFYSSPFGPFYRRHTPYMVQPEYRIYEMNKRLQSRTEDSDNLWWDAFATEFFEDDATLTLSFCLEDGPKRYRTKNLRPIGEKMNINGKCYRQDPHPPLL
ncbi:LDB2 isoform 6 [Pan troglodytes]|uniref:LIM domain binding 2 n=3 Tax=Catarrhini TaxID=9526 RepID=E9PGU0_HUMAN|nr:LIM domain binding 2 [Homo sapiens]KAI4024960.1 LIM domain binding 2 [Homo sapiens]PNI76051.1 LDB2 isoform 6 [Pan troglodytes]